MTVIKKPNVENTFTSTFVRIAMPPFLLPAILASTDISLGMRGQSILGAINLTEA